MNKIFSDIADVFGKNGNRITQLILINILVFFTFNLLVFGIGLFPNLIFSASHITENVIVSSNLKQLLFHPWTLVFHPFNHQGLWPLVFDMLLLFWFGNMLADLIGGKKTISIYLTTALFSVAFFMLIWGSFKLLNTSIFTEPYLYGASAGVFGIMLSYVTLNPDSEIMFFTFRLKVRILVFIFLVLSLFKSSSLGILDLGGALAGFLIIFGLKRGINSTSFLEKILFRKEKSRIINKTPLTKTSKVVPFKAYTATGKPTQEEVDFLLDKINKEGYEALSKEEKQRLHHASQSAD